MDTYRITIEMPDHLRKRVLAMQEQTDAVSVVQVIREALATYEQIVAALRDGKTIILRAADGTEQIFVPVAAT